MSPSRRPVGAYAARSARYTPHVLPRVPPVILRPRRILAILRRDLHLVLAGRPGVTLVGLLLLIPLGLLPTGSNADARPALSELPAALSPTLSARVDLRPGAPARLLTREDGALLVEGSVSPPLRAALDEALGAPTLTLHRVEPARTLPSRALLVVLLAISMLTGPLSETLPGERGGRTLETLMAAAVSREEIITGKWAAWAGYATVGAGCSVLAGLLTGAQTPGWWMLGVPMVLGTAVALGLWLVRGAADVVSGATVPMRVVPVVVCGLGAVAWGLAGWSPLIGASVPIGGALLVASDALRGVGPLLVAGAVSALTVGIFLRQTALALDAEGPAPELAQRVLLVVQAALIWWLMVPGPAIWALQGGALRPSIDAGAAAGGLWLGLLALLLAVREAPERVALAPSPWVRRGLEAVGIGVVLGVLWGVSPGLGEGPMAERLRAVLVAPGIGGLIAAIGSELFFRGALARRIGAPAAGLAFVLIVGPASPLWAGLSAVILGILASRRGVEAAVLARVIAWAVAWGLSG